MPALQVPAAVELSPGAVPHQVSPMPALAAGAFPRPAVHVADAAQAAPALAVRAALAALAVPAALAPRVVAAAAAATEGAAVLQQALRR